MIFRPLPEANADPIAASAKADPVAAFYGRRRGAVAGALIREALAACWPDLRGLRLLGLGHAARHLALWRADAASCASLRWQRAAPWRDASSPPIPEAEVDPACLPLPDRSIDRIVLVHALELAGDQRRLLRECWRLLADDGRLLVVVPNRTGAWAHVETTPFGDGRPYSAGQLARLLAASMFAPERRMRALFAPPFGPAPGLRAARRIDAVGRAVAPGLSGVLIVEAVKDQYAAIPPAAIRPPRLRLAPQRAPVRAA